MAQDHTSTEPVPEEMGLGDVLRELYRWKWVILGVTLLAGAAAAGYSLMQPNVYESTAALVVQEPKLTGGENDETGFTSEVPSMSVETLQTLAESTSIVRTLFEQLWESGEIKKSSGGEDAQFRQFQQKLQTSLKRQESSPRNAVSLLPILVLKAKADSPAEAQQIANAWSKLVEERAGQVYTEGVKALEGFTKSVYDESSSTLQASETALAQYKVDAQVTLKKARLETLTAQLVGLEQDVQQLEAEIQLNRTAIEQGKTRVAQQQYENEWIGSYVEEVLRNGQDPFANQELSPAVETVVTAVRKLVEMAEGLREYREQKDIVGKTTEFNHYRWEIPKIRERTDTVEREIPSARAKVAALEEQLENVPERITLSKAITEDALWNAYLKGDMPEGDRLVPLKEEVANPVYQSTKEQLVEERTELKALQASSENLNTMLESMENKRRALESELDILNREVDRREAAIEETETLLQTLRDDYTEEMNNVGQLVVENARLQEERGAKSELLEAGYTTAENLEREILTGENKIDALTREVEKSKAVQKALATKAEEAALLGVSAENASQTRISILYEAEANPLKVAPSRSKIVLASMLAALFLCSFLVVASRVVRAQDAGSN